MQVRVNKYISESGYCSRREADKYIGQGCVTIDGEIAEIGSQVSPGQVVKVFGEAISNNIKSVVLAYNKPVGVVSTTDPDERDNIVNAVGYPERIFPVGRLDKDSQGLILLTNDGDIVNKILRANNNHDKEYFVTVNKPINADFIQRMQGGIPILGVVTRKCEVTQQGSNSFAIVLRQGLNRQIRRMCEYLGYTVIKLQRTRLMHIRLGNLKIGQYRSLTEAESAMLYKRIEKSVGVAPEKETGNKRGKRKLPAISTAKATDGKTPAKAPTEKARTKSVTRGRAASGGFKTAKSSGRNASFRPRGKETGRSGGR